MDFFNPHHPDNQDHHHSLTHPFLPQELYNTTTTTATFPSTYQQIPVSLPFPYDPTTLQSSFVPFPQPLTSPSAATTSAPAPTLSTTSASSSSFAPLTPPVQNHGGQSSPIRGQYIVGEPSVSGFQGMTPPGNVNGRTGSISQKGGQKEEEGNRGGSNSEDENLTPAQSRRKAQNRAAQRAFRERKERHVKELQDKLTALEAAASQTASENAILKRSIEKISIENKILRATGEAIATYAPAATDAQPLITGPQTYNPDTFYNTVLEKHANKARSHRVVVAEDGGRFLAAAATWDYIVEHEMFRRGRVDPSDVSDLLKNQARCDGQGPVFKESDVEMAIMACVNEDGDDEML